MQNILAYEQYLYYSAYRIQIALIPPIIRNKLPGVAALFRNILRYTSGNSSRYRRRAIPSPQSSSSHWSDSSDTITSSRDQQIPLTVGLPSPPTFAPPASLTPAGNPAATSRIP